MKLVTYRKDRGYWEADYYIGGKRQRSRLPFDKLSQKAEAREFAKTLYLKQYNGEIFEECQTTFRQMAETYLQSKTSGIKGRRYRLEVIYKFIGDTKLNKISFLDIEQIKRHLKQERGIKNQSINRYLADVSAILNFAKKNRVISDFPPITRLDREPERPTRALTEEEQIRIYEVLPDYLKDPFILALSTGWRRANLVNFKRKHLTKRPDGTWKVCFSAEEMKGRVPFEHICNKEETKIINRNLSLEYQHIFRRETKVNGTKTTHLGDFKKAINQARKDYGVFFTWHWLRHTRATTYAKQGVQEQTMNALMSWSPKSRMAGNYSHITEEDFLAGLREKVGGFSHL